MKTSSYLYLILVIGISACYRTDKPADPDQPVVIKDSMKVIVNDEQPQFNKNDYMVLAALFHQQSAEYRALCYQAYNFGRYMLDIDLKDKSIDKHRIVVLDIDETVLDNSPYQAQCVIDEINYPVRWDEWCSKASAEAVPGALDFTKYARANGVSVFYITNRKQHLRDVTIENLRKLGFPHADTTHVIMRTSEISKEGRRNDLLEKYHIALLCGDNLSDFSYVFDEVPNSLRKTEASRLQEEFGSKFIVLPNAMYGDWELEIYKRQKQQSDSVKSMKRINALQGF